MRAVLVAYELDALSTVKLSLLYLRRLPFAFVCLCMCYFALVCLRLRSYAFDRIRVLSFGLVSAWCMRNALLIFN